MVYRHANDSDVLCLTSHAACECDADIVNVDYACSSVRFSGRQNAVSFVAAFFGHSLVTPDCSCVSRAYQCCYLSRSVSACMAVFLSVAFTIKPPVFFSRERLPFPRIRKNSTVSGPTQVLGFLSAFTVLSVSLKLRHVRSGHQWFT